MCTGASIVIMASRCLSAHEHPPSRHDLRHPQHGTSSPASNQCFPKDITVHPCPPPHSSMPGTRLHPTPCYRRRMTEQSTGWGTRRVLTTLGTVLQRSDSRAEPGVGGPTLARAAASPRPRASFAGCDVGSGGSGWAAGAGSPSMELGSTAHSGVWDSAVGAPKGSDLQPSLLGGLQQDGVQACAAPDGLLSRRGSKSARIKFQLSASATLDAGAQGSATPQRPRPRASDPGRAGGLTKEGALSGRPSLGSSRLSRPSLSYCAAAPSAPNKGSAPDGVHALIEAKCDDHGDPAPIPKREPTSTTPVPCLGTGPALQAPLGAAQGAAQVHTKSGNGPAPLHSAPPGSSAAHAMLPHALSRAPSSVVVPPLRLPGAQGGCAAGSPEDKISDAGMVERSEGSRSAFSPSSTSLGSPGAGHGTGEARRMFESSVRQPGNVCREGGWVAWEATVVAGGGWTGLCVKDRRTGRENRRCMRLVQMVHKGCMGVHKGHADGPKGLPGSAASHAGGWG